MLELRDIHKELGGRPVLAGVSLKVERGQTLVILGPSGAGKSVTLQHLVGLLRPDQGQVLVDGEDIHAAPPRERERLRNKFGMLFQSGALIAWMNVFDNVALPLYEKTRLGDAEIRAIVERRLQLVGLEGQGEKMPAELSGGMRKRAGLARAIVRDPAIILYDEPTSGLDPVLSRMIDQLIRDLQRELKVTSVVVTHDLQSAILVADQVAMLYEGRIVELAPPRQFLASGHPFVRRFIDAQFAAREFNHP
ncbi:MAG: ABC transporter ATP-binding protein [Lentisphaeria bacterium]|jgi:phospholipid/cholesterol/gamma-HCH transport system ATP-binding protein